MFVSKFQSKLKTVKTQKKKKERKNLDTPTAANHSVRFLYAQAKEVIRKT